MKSYIYSLNEIPNIVEQLKEGINEKGCNILALRGPLGAGKTTLIRELVSSMGVPEEEIISPTFNYVNIYRVNRTDDSDESIYHFDLYRVSSEDEFLQAGFDEYLNSGELVLIEWPEVIESLLKDKKVCWVDIDYEGVDKRKLTFWSL
jgi:tRNA threonylcarbamoyladenosine biosynthesis protein TsaE